MTEKTEQMPETNASSTDVFPYSGKILRDAREARGLSVEAVSSQLRLGVELITALEQDDYENLPPPTFVGGYLRNYARLLDLPEKDIIDGYRHCVGGESLSLVAATTLQKQAKASDLSVRLVTYLLVIGLSVLLLMWWMAEREEMSSFLPEVITAIESGIAVTAKDETEIVVSDVGNDKDSTNVEQATAETTTIESTTPIQDENALSTKVSVSEITAVSENTETTSSAEQVEPLQKEVISLSIPPLTADMPQAEVMLEFSQESWVEVYDNAGRHLVYELIPAGEILLLQGEAPFKVFLGNAQGVQLFYQKESFDHSLYRRGDLAKFRLGNSSDNKLPSTSEEE